MVFDITQLRKIRKQLDMTQHAFAKEIGISQSMIAKIESGRLDPTYSYVKKIEATLARLTHHEEKEAKDIMHKGLFFVSADHSVIEAISLMVKYSISQMPVMERGKVIGLITESGILAQGEIDTKKVSDIMIESPPIIDTHAQLENIVQLLKFYPLLLIQESGKLVGVVTKADVLKTLK